MNQALIEFVIARLREEVDRLLDGAPRVEVRTLTGTRTQVISDRKRDGLDLGQQHELAMVEAMWSIVHAAASCNESDETHEGYLIARTHDRTLRLLGAIWSGHVEYRKEWRP